MNASLTKRPSRLRAVLAARHGAGAVALALVALGAATILVSAVVHLYLWGRSDGYRAVPTIGPLFLAQGIVGCLLGMAMIAVRRVGVTAAAAVYMALSIGGLYLSIHGGLFDYQETLDAPYVKLSLVVEAVGLVAAVGACAVTFVSTQRSAG